MIVIMVEAESARSILPGWVPCLPAEMTLAARPKMFRPRIPVGFAIHPAASEGEQDRHIGAIRPRFNATNVGRRYGRFPSRLRVIFGPSICTPTPGGHGRSRSGILRHGG
jgi:hypothetical protein